MSHYHSPCPINYEWDRCSSKEHGLTCKTCCHYNEEDSEMWKWLELEHCSRCGINEPYEDYAWCLSCKPELIEDCE